MSFSSVCPACGAVFELGEELQGSVVRCGRCQQTFTAGSAFQALATGSGGSFSGTQKR